MVRARLSVSFMACLALGACGDDSKEGRAGGTGGEDETGGTGGTTTGGTGGGASGGRGGSSSGGGGGGGGGGTAGGGSGGSSSMGGSGGSSSTGGAGGSGGSAGAGGSGGSRADGGAAGSGGGRGDGGADAAGGSADGGGGGVSPMMSFFLSSKGSGKGGDFGGLEGADRHCTMLAMAVSPQLGAKTWRAYLSTSTVSAASRIGQGPWRNAKGVVVANSLKDLHEGQAMDGALAATWPIGNAAFDVILDEKGAKHENAVHDILTGSTMAGIADGNNHCSNWTSQMGMGAVGHSNRTGGGRPPSWNAAHAVGCGSELDATGKLQNRVGGTVTSGGGRGSIYCFAVGQ